VEEKPKTRTVSETAINNRRCVLKKKHLNSLCTVHGGLIYFMADDMAGRLVAKRHRRHTYVTVAGDKVRYLSWAEQGDVLLFNLAINRVWGSSMEVGVKVYATNLQKGTWTIFSTYLTLVAVKKENGNLQPIPIGCQVVPETEDEIRRYEKANIRREWRLLEEKEEKYEKTLRKGKS